MIGPELPANLCGIEIVHRPKGSQYWHAMYLEPETYPVCDLILVLRRSIWRALLGNPPSRRPDARNLSHDVKLLERYEP